MANNVGNIVKSIGLFGNLSTAKAPTPFGYATSPAPSPFITTYQPKPAAAPMPTSLPSTGSIKAHTVNADGSTKTEYHNPDQQSTATKAQAPIANPSIVGNAVIPTPPAGTPDPVNLNSPAPGTNPSATQNGTTTIPASFGGLIGALNNIGTQGSAGYTQAVQNLADFRRKVAGEQANISQVPIELGFQQGRQQVLTQKTAQEDAALQNAVNQQQAQQQQQISALSSAGGLVPEALRYGAFGNSSSSTNLDPQTQATQLADLVNSGQLTYADAVSQMNSYGAIGIPTLRNAILAKNPNFNFAQAQALGSTQGTVAPLLNQAQLAIQNLQNVFNNIPGWQKTGIPAVNALTGLLSEIGIGTGTQKDKENALSEARTQVANALGVATNTTPSAWTATVQGWFPDNATPDQITAGIQQFNNLAANRQSIFGTPGASQPFTPQQFNQNNAQPTTGNSIYSW